MKKILLILLCLPIIGFGQSSGTGFAIHSDGYIATNFHVISGADKIQITGINGEFQKYYEARIIKIDKSNDLAILKIDQNLGRIPYGFKKTKEDIAANVYAYGYPLPEIQGYEIKITDGIISSNSGLKDDPRWYQHTSSIQPGNSGGPLFNKYGNLVGINNAVINNEALRKNYGTETQNVNYAIKSRYLYNLMEDLELSTLINSGINKLELSEQYKSIRKFVYFISVSNSKDEKSSKSTTSIIGSWSGFLDFQGQDMELIFHFEKENNEYIGTLDIPSQGAIGIPIEKIEISVKKQLSLSLMGGTITYKGILENKLITGKFKQGAIELDLNLNKTEMKKPGNINLPSSEKALELLAAQETGNYKYNVDDYFARPKSSSFKLSPNGKYMSFRKKDENLKNHVYVKNVTSGEENRIIVEGEELIRGYGWANEERLVYVMDKGGNEDYHLFAINIDGSNQKELTPYDGVKVNILELLKEDKNHMIISMNMNNPQVFEPYKINIITGEIEQLYENNDLQSPIDGYVFDKNGDLRAYSKLKDGVKYELFYKMDDNNFKLIHETNWDESFYIRSFNYASENKHEAYVVSNLQTDKTEIFSYDLSKNKVIKKLFSNDQYDVSGISISRNRNWELDYFSYEGEKYNLVPVSDYFKKLHSRLSEEFENYDFYISDKTDDESQYLIYVTSDKLYGKYYFFDVEKNEIKLLFDLMPQLDEEDMSTMKPIKFKSRDGLTVHGYITLPKSAIDGEKVPVIVNPHGGPQGVRDSWGFNPEAQLFASRGYATLHVNFRISGGYGKEFLRKGFKEIGRKAMDDVEDGLQYVIQQGWVDAEKVAIYGASHGGYAVLRGLTKTPELYSCGIDYVGVSNLYTFMQSMPAYWKPYLEIIKAIWYDEDNAEEKKIMDEVSPVFHIDKITKPLFVIQGANDPRVNIDESDQIVSGLRSKGVDVPYMVKYDEGHGFGKEENMMDLYKAMMGFLAQNLKN